MKNSFGKNLKKVLSFSLIAQGIPILSLPILTRLYSEDNFGALSLFLSIVGVTSILFSLRLDFSIFLYDTEKKINNILKTIIILQPLFIVLSYVFLFLAVSFDLLMSNDIYMLILVPIGSSSLAIYMAYTTKLNKLSNYNFLVKLKVIIPMIILFFSVSLAFIFDRNYSQIYSYLIAYIIISLLIFFKTSFQNFKLSTIKNILVDNKRFLIYSLPSDIFNSFNNIGFPVLLYYFYDLKVVGLYFLAMKLVKVPTSLILSSISYVYNQQASDLINQHRYQKVFDLTRTLQFKIALYLLPFLILLSFLAPTAFDLVFGDNWRASGELIKYFAVFIFFNGIYSPISQIGNFLEKQNILLYFNFSLNISNLIIFISLYNKFSFENVLLISSISGAIHFIWLNFFMNKQLKLKSK